MAVAMRRRHNALRLRVVDFAVVGIQDYVAVAHFYGLVIGADGVFVVIAFLGYSGAAIQDFGEMRVYSRGFVGQYLRRLFHVVPRLVRHGEYALGVVREQLG